MNKKYIVKLNEQERHHLEELVNHGKSAARKIQRAWILLKTDVGPQGPAWNDQRIRETFGPALVTIYRVRQTWVEEGLQAVLNRAAKSGHRHRRLDGEQEARLIALACTQPPIGRRRWTLRLLAGKMVELGYTDSVCVETIRQTLKKTKSSLTW
jgi:transposase